MVKWTEEQKVEDVTIAHASGAAEAAKVTDGAAGGCHGPELKRAGNDAHNPTNGFLCSPSL